MAEDTGRGRSAAIEGLDWARLRDAIPYVVYVYDLDTGRSEYLSRQLGELLGYSAAEVAAMGGRVVEALCHPEDLARLPELLARWDHAKDGEVLETEHRMRHAGGEYRTLLGRDTVLVRRPDGTVRRILGTSIDVTERRALEERLQHAERLELVGRVSGGIAHDFNNLLTAMLGGVDLAEAALTAGGQAGPDVPAALAALRDAREAVLLAAELTRQLLVFARRAPPSRGPLDVGAQVRAATRMVEAVAGSRVSVAVDTPAEPCLASIGAVELVQILLNLAANARDAMPDGGSLRIGVTSRDDGGAVIEVADTGAGMPGEVAARLFEPFFTTKAPGAGTGLGLAQVAQLVSAAGGRVGVESEVGRGTRFRVELPPPSDDRPELRARR